jgi:CRISPR-associated endonuclease Csn1
MEKILGIDTGTNSLGWGIVQKEETGNYTLLEHGVNIFQEGVKIEKGIESSRAAERTGHRSIRVHYWRRKVRKIRLITVLSQAHLCPPVSFGMLREWRTKRIYPHDQDFLIWQRTDESQNINPYYYRYLCLTKKLDLSDLSQRYILGRALYHLNQRRGFLSNRKESTKESEGNVKQGISQLSEDIAAAGCRYLGEYFYTLYQKGEKIRSHYTARNEHYLAEFHAICAMQQLDADLVGRLEKVIFFQRPLKSQKQQVGKCTFEPKKARCSTSHPLYEEYRMYAFINNVKVKTPKDDDLRPLTTDEKELIIPLFMRKSKPSFTFDDIAKKIAAGKKNYAYAGDKGDKPYKFNYHMDTNVSGCPVTAGLREIFGESWVDAVCEVYTLAKGKFRLEIVNDIWHALFFYDDDDKLKGFAQDRLQLSEEDAEKFCKIRVAQDYAALSLKAIKKILPYLRDYGLIYSEAIFLANLCEVVPSYIWNTAEMRRAVIENVIEVMHSDESDTEGFTTEQRVKSYLKETYFVEDKDLKKLYHPSMIDVYPRQRRNDDGIYQLGSPRINSVRNPMAMHSLFRLRKVVNQLLAEGKIDEETVIHIEFARDLNDANRRKAIQDYQRFNEKDRETCKKKIQELFAEKNMTYEPTDTDVLKYQLWEEQGHICLYTGESIGLTDFLGSNPKYDIEHTIPRSVGGDSTKMNLTLCQNRFNREIKKAYMPSQLANHEDILQRIASWKETYEELDKRIRKLRGSSAATKEMKDSIIQRRHRLSLERDYWRGKYQRFTMTEVPEGFSRRQGTDISVISRYARLYLRSVFHKVFIVKGIATSDFRKIWGIQEEYEKKARVNHAHHCVDAITIACIGPNEYAKLAKYYHALEEFEKYGNERPSFEKPWPDFVNDMKHIQDDLLVAHYTQDNMMKSARRRILTPEGKKLAMGDVARGSLHLDTYYGAIERDGEVKYVVRKSLNSIEEKDVKNIVDDVVREKVEKAIAIHGGLKKAVEADDIWMNRDKGVRIAKVRLYAGSVTRPINMRQQRDESVHEYKRQYHVQNDRNYMMAIYVGKTDKGKEKREFELVNNLMAADFYRRSNERRKMNDTLFPLKSKKGYDLTYLLRIGGLVLLYEESPEEVWDLDASGLQRRLYKITGLSSMVISGNAYGTISLVHHQDARPGTDVKLKNGAYVQNEEFRAGIKELHTQFKALIEGVDFKLNELGEITRLI